jgi:hypothetical protein
MMYDRYDEDIVGCRAYGSAANNNLPWKSIHESPLEEWSRGMKEKACIDQNESAHV